jgi:iron(III) transport system substrate-binding protein
MRLPRKHTGYRRAIGAALATVLACAVAACSSTTAPATTAPSATPAAPVPVDTLVTRSHNEHGLIMYGNTPTKIMQPLLDGFSKAYPWIKPEYSQLSDNQVFTKYQSEHAQSATSSDLLLSASIPQFLQARQNRLLANVTPSGLENFPAFINQGHGVYVMAPNPVTYSWNAKLLAGSKVPTSYAELVAAVQASPAQYPLISYSPQNPLGYADVYGLIHILGTDTVYKYLDVLGKHTKTFDEGLDGLQYMVQGGASVGYLSSGLAQSIIPQYKGLLGYGFMKDATPLSPNLVAQTASAANPASAQLFLDFVYSNPGQQIMCAAGMEASMNNFKSATGCTANLTDLATKVPASAIYLVPVSQDVVDQQKAITARWNQALGR